MDNECTVVDESRGYVSEYNDIIQALTENYLNVYIIEPEANMASFIKLEGYITQGILQAPKRFKYNDMLKAYLSGRVYENDKEMFYNKLNSDELISYFKKGSKQLEISYRAISNSEIHYYSAHYICINKPNQPLKVVAGFRNVDDIVLNQIKIKEEGLYKAYEALSSIYLTMHRIDLINDTFHEIKGTKLVTSSYICGVESFKENAKKATIATTNPAFIDTMLKFVDIETLPDRLKGKNNISIEFRSNLYGWCKATYIKEDEDESGKLWHVLYTVQVIEDEHQKEALLRKMAETDPLLGIFNRRKGELKIKESLEKHEDGAFCIMDCDNFKYINDHYGHDVGDLVLITIVKNLEAICDKDDIIMRLGGDELAIYTHGKKTVDDVYGIWGKVKQSLKDLKIPQLYSTPVSMSAGLCFIKPDENVSFADIYRLADKAMYESKKIEGPSIEII